MSDLIGYMVATPFEAKGITNSNNSRVILTGIGAKDLEDNLHATKFNDLQQVNCLISFGTAASLDPSLKTGDIILANQVHAATTKEVLTIDDFWQSKIEQHLRSKENISKTNILSSNKIITSAQQKLALFKQYNTSAVDMESFEIAKFAQAKNIPFVVLRVIIDEQQQEIPKVLAEHLNKYDDVKLNHLLGSLLLNPLQWWSFFKLIRSYSTASKVLREVNELLSKEF